MKPAEEERGRKKRRRFSKKISNEWGTSGKELGRAENFQVET